MNSKATVTQSSQAKNDVDFVVHKLREAITSGDMVPNQRLIEADLCEMYGATRGAIRLALAELTSDGLIERVQHKGARVRMVTLAEAEEILEIRSALESLCAAKAAERATKPDISDLRALGDKMKEAAESGNQLQYSEYNKQLHEKIIDISGLKIAAETVRKLRGQNVRYQFKLSQQPGRSEVSLPEHLRIIDAIESGNGQLAATAMQAHLSSVLGAVKQLKSMS